MNPTFPVGGVNIGPATPEDVPEILQMLAEVAESLGFPQNFGNSPESLNAALFSTPPTCEAVVARDAESVFGFASWLEIYRPFSGRKAIWLDYIYVRPEFRRKPIAFALLRYILGIARQRDCVAISGLVLETNQAKSLYAIFGAVEDDARLFTLHLSKVNWSLFGSDYPEQTE